MSVVLRETVNTIRVNYLLDTYTFKDFYDTWDGTKLDAKHEYDKTMKYLASKLDPINDVIKYNYCKGRNDGRMIGEKSIQNCKREIRGFLCDKLTIIPRIAVISMRILTPLPTANPGNILAPVVSRGFA